ncbi:MAG: hypothetical protein O3C40_23545 [Planctomycetota bacterium]|nr:hypothetical protein [Planctomycetota bacterium]
MLWNFLTDYFRCDASLLAEPTMIARSVLQMALFCGSAFFSGSEIALVNAETLRGKD